MPSSSSFIAEGELQRSIIENPSDDGAVSPHFDLDRKAVWGLYCMYAIIGLVYGFIQNFITIPICYYVFGPLQYPAGFVDQPTRASLQQCNIGTAITTMPWNLKVFYGLFLDQFGFFGTRRKGWIIFGWTGGLGMLALTGALSGSLANEEPRRSVHQGLSTDGEYPEGDSNFFLYTMLLLVMCAFYIFSDVAGDGMTIELSRFEPPESRGYILTTGQMIRFTTTIFANIVGIVCMNGKDYVAPNKADKAFDFQVSFPVIHFVLVAICLPFYLGMIFWLKDPPREEDKAHHSTSEIMKKLWELMKTKVMLFLICGSLLNMAIASLTNPAQNIMQQIVNPSSLNQGVGSMFGNVIFLIGVWIFRTFLMDRNWRYTFVATGLILALNSVFMYIMIYNMWGIGQSPWFFVFGNNILQIIQGVSQVLSSLAVVEVAPKGFEASVYEFLTTINNAGITLNYNLMGIFQPIFKVSNIIADGHDYKGESQAMRDADNQDMANATTFTMIVNVVGVIITASLIPKDKAQCKEWLEAPGFWKTTINGVLGSVVGWGCLLFSLTVSFLGIIPSTMCLPIAGGDGCGGSDTTATTTAAASTSAASTAAAWFI
jgi:hypothetical protein